MNAGYTTRNVRMEDVYGTSLPGYSHPLPPTTQEASGPVGTSTSPAIPMVAFIGMLVILRLAWEYGKKG